MLYNNKTGCAVLCSKGSLRGPRGPRGPQGPAGTSVNSLQYSVALEQSGVPTEFVLAGVDPSQNAVPGAFGLMDDFTTPFSVYNNHIYITINSITATDPLSPCEITVTGTSISESTAVPVTNDTETITFNASNNTSYQTLKKWLEGTSIELTSNITSINYDISILGYVDFLNTNTRITGYRAEVLSGNKTTDDITLIINRIKQNNPVTTILPLENITIDGDSNTLIDNLRSGSFDRSYSMTSANLWPELKDFVLKQSDFNTYFTNNENLIESTDNEGIIIKVTSTNLGAPNGPTYLNLMIYFTIVE
jgi:hypothetical protein